MTITPFCVNPLSENCYVVSDETREAVIIDCGALYPAEQKKIADYIQEHELLPVAHLLTHAHFDHLFGAGFIYEHYGLAARCHIADRPLFDDVDGQMRAILGGHALKFATSPAGEWLTEESVISFGNHRLTVIPCPGHTPGGVCFYCVEENVLFSGDSLFQWNIGRTDFPGGSLWDLISALKRLLRMLPQETVIYPGHGPSTTAAQEHVHNPYLS